MSDYGLLIYTDARRWLFDNGDTLTEVAFCLSWWQWWRTTRYTGRYSSIILGCVARHQGEDGGAPPVEDEDVYRPLGRPARAAPRDRRRQAHERRIAGL
jgi:hypothetical protein